MFITFEGGEGAGKSTLMERLYEALRARGNAVLKTRAPGGTRAGEMMRALLLNKEGVSLVPRAELLLFLADRAQHVAEVIAPALKRGEIVLCDRYNDSTIAYQGIARGLGEEETKKLCRFATDGLEPDLTFYLDLDPAIGLKRLEQAKNGKDRIEAEKLSFHEKIRAAFHQIATKEKTRFRILDASKTSDQVFTHAMEVIDALLASSR
ncbi:MAG: dTMP kinase [Chlamydiales bacterium]